VEREGGSDSRPWRREGNERSSRFLHRVAGGANSSPAVARGGVRSAGAAKFSIPAAQDDSKIRRAGCPNAIKISARAAMFINIFGYSREIAARELSGLLAPPYPTSHDPSRTLARVGLDSASPSRPGFCGLSVGIGLARTRAQCAV